MRHPVSSVVAGLALAWAAGCQGATEITPSLVVEAEVEAGAGQTQIQVVEEESMEALPGTVVLVREVDQPLATYRAHITDEEGFVRLPLPEVAYDVRAFPERHLPILTRVAREESWHILASAVVADAAYDEGGSWKVGGKAGLMIQPGRKPLPERPDLRALSIRPERSSEHMEKGGRGVLTSTFVEGLLPGHSQITMMSAWAPRPGAKIEVFFIDAHTLEQLGRTTGAFVDLDGVRVIDFETPDLDGAERAMWIIAAAEDVAPEAEVKDARSLSCCPAGSWNCQSTVTQTNWSGLIDCCSSSGSCSQTHTLTLSTQVKIGLPDWGPVEVEVQITASSSYSATCGAGPGQRGRMGLRAHASAFVQCDFWWGLPWPSCFGHGCFAALCASSSCYVPETVCETESCCTPATCDGDYWGQCGTFSDGCGGQIDCGCWPGEVCESGWCEQDYGGDDDGGGGDCSDSWYPPWCPWYCTDVEMMN